MYRYLIQTKPRIILLLTITGIVGFLIPSLNDISLLNLILFVFFGVSAAAGALTINNVIDRDIDVKMIRTADRPSLGPDAISTFRLMTFGIVLSIIGIVGGYFYFGLYTAIQLAWGNLFYLIGYSLYLKRRSILNTILGGLASPAPVWAGYAARFEDLSIEPSQAFLGVPLQGWLLGGLVFIWTPSHTWAMAVKNFDDYKNADIPMLPVVVGIEKTGFYSLIGGIFTLIYGIWLSYWMVGNSLILLALVLPNLYFLYGLWKFYDSPSIESARECFKIHNYWLTIIFGTILLFHWT